MQIESLRPARSGYLDRGAAKLSREAQKRLAWFDYYEGHGRNAALTCRHFGISGETFYAGSGATTLKTCRPRKTDLTARTAGVGRPGPSGRRSGCGACESAIHAGANISWRCCRGGKAGRCRSRWWAGSGLGTGSRL